jgi:hypothetical protein
MTKHPLTLINSIDVGPQTGISAIHCDIAKRKSEPIPPPIPTRKYLLMQARSSRHSNDSCRHATFALWATARPQNEEAAP